MGGFFFFEETTVALYDVRGVFGEVRYGTTTGRFECGNDTVDSPLGFVLVMVVGLGHAASSFLAQFKVEEGRGVEYRKCAV
jgi:hypothetical protein